MTRHSAARHESHFELKRLDPSAVPAALERAEHYRLLNEAQNAESICLDILDTEPSNEPALIALVLSITDQFPEVHDLDSEVRRARDFLSRFADAYTRAYYGGLICERRAKALAARGGARNHFIAYDAFRQAMDLYEEAISLRPEADDDAILRWNTCARILMKNRHLEPDPRDGLEHPIE